MTDFATVNGFRLPVSRGSVSVSDLTSGTVVGCYAGGSVDCRRSPRRKWTVATPPLAPDVAQDWREILAGRHLYGDLDAENVPLGNSIGTWDGDSDVEWDDGSISGTAGLRFGWNVLGDVGAYVDWSTGLSEYTLLAVVKVGTTRYSIAFRSGSAATAYACSLVETPTVWAYDEINSDVLISDIGTGELRIQNGQSEGDYFWLQSLIVYRRRLCDELFLELAYRFAQTELVSPSPSLRLGGLLVSPGVLASGTPLTRPDGSLLSRGAVESSTVSACAINPRYRPYGGTGPISYAAAERLSVSLEEER